MDIHIREIESKDYTSAAAIWRDVLGFSSVTDESVIETYEKMKGDDRYCTFVAEVNNTVVGFATTVETLAIDHPNGYMKLRLDLHQVFSGQVRIGEILGAFGDFKFEFGPLFGDDSAFRQALNFLDLSE